MKMSDSMDSLDTEDTEEDIYVAHSNQNSRTLRSRNSINQVKVQDNSMVRRSTRTKSQKYDNLNSSWIYGTQTLKGYPMYNNRNDSSSDKEMMNDESVRKQRRGRISRKSQENHSPNKSSSRHLRNHDHNHTDRTVRSERELRNRHILRNRPQLRERTRVSFQSFRALRRQQQQPVNESKTNDQVQNTEKSESRTPSDKETGSKKPESPQRLRGRPVTRLSNNFPPKNVKNVKSEPEADEEESSEDESDKADNNDNSENGNQGFQDMYTRVKRTRRASQRKLPNRKLPVDSDSDSTDTPGPRKYSLRQKKPTVDRFQATIEPQKSLKAFKNVFRSSIRMRRKHKSSSSSDSSDSEPQRYDKKKNKKSRQTALPQGGPSDKKADISPISVDSSISFKNVGGLESHVHCLKEMVVFPMMYPDVFDRFKVTPPKGVLFHGSPGTGKTLIARALANECNQGNKKVSFFMRKGADCLSKWVGESERQLRLLFEQAQQMKPSIIFFDEIDGLAPVRSTKQDQIHASIVSTLLALLDGLNDRGEVIVIGATNRIDAIDPALRRPGRFDRELYFPLPAMKERLEILKIHVSKWENPPSDEMLEALAEKAIGYTGSDLKALCTEAVIQSLKRTYPQIYKTNKRLLLKPESVEVKEIDFAQAGSLLIPSSQRVTAYSGKKLPQFLEPLLTPSLNELLKIIKGIFPQGVNPALAKHKIIKGVHQPRLLITADKIFKGQGPRLAQALIYHMEHLPVITLDISTLFAESARSPEETCVQVFNEAARNVPSIIYIRAVDKWWSLVPETVKAVFMCRTAALDPVTPIFILATSDGTHNELPVELQNLFNKLRGSVYIPDKVTEEQRTIFFKPIFLVQSLTAPERKSKNNEKLEELPLAPDPAPKKLTEEEKRKLYETEEVSLRELRIFLREICAKLARNKQFFMFTKPVDTEEVPDYKDIIQHPMDLESMMTKIDMHYYLCARDFLDDVDLIWRNALEYNPDRDPADKLIRHRACSLRDTAYALIKAELDSDFEDKCREISKNRQKDDEIENDSKETPNSKTNVSNVEKVGKSKDINDTGSVTALNGRRLPSSRKRKVPAWARGFVKKGSTKKKKITYDGACESGIKSIENAESPNGMDLKKFQEFETEMNSVTLNGHLPFNDNSDSENGSHIEILSKENLLEKQNSSRKTSHESELGNENNLENLVNGKNNVSPVSFRNENTVADFSLVNDSDSSLTNETTGDKVLIDKSELENALLYTVRHTENFSIELLSDVYLNLSRCVDRYARLYDRKSLPKLLIEEVKRFEINESTKKRNI